VFELKIFQIMAIEMLTNNKIQINFFQLNLQFSKTNYIIVHIIERYLWINFQFYHLDKLSINMNDQI
jgi:hypothetical protein